MSHCVYFSLPTHSQASNHHSAHALWKQPQENKNKTKGFYSQTSPEKQEGQCHIWDSVAMPGSVASVLQQLQRDWPRARGHSVTWHRHKQTH